jgi:hypothetical protein
MQRFIKLQQEELAGKFQHFAISGRKVLRDGNFRVVDPKFYSQLSNALPETHIEHRYFFFNDILLLLAPETSNSQKLKWKIEVVEPWKQIETKDVKGKTQSESHHFRISKLVGCIRKI